jgi:hypothetical protein
VSRDVAGADTRPADEGGDEPRRANPGRPSAHHRELPRHLT